MKFETEEELTDFVFGAILSKLISFVLLTMGIRRAVTDIVYLQVPAWRFAYIMIFFGLFGLMLFEGEPLKSIRENDFEEETSEYTEIPF